MSALDGWTTHHQKHGSSGITSGMLSSTLSLQTSGNDLNSRPSPAVPPPISPRFAPVQGTHMTSLFIYREPFQGPKSWILHKWDITHSFWIVNSDLSACKHEFSNHHSSHNEKWWTVFRGQTCPIILVCPKIWHASRVQWLIFITMNRGIYNHPLLGKRYNKVLYIPLNQISLQNGCSCKS
jgi:hypothetical protein